MRCESVTGWGHFGSETYGVTRIGFHGCREQVTPFEMSCSEVGSSGGAIKTNAMTSSTVIEGGAPHLLLNSAESSFICGGGRVVRIEGFFIGEMVSDVCGGTTRDYGLHMEFIAHGHEGSLVGAANFDVYIDGYGDQDYEFETPWSLKFDRAATLIC
jgi:hypothetical protein